MAMHYGHTTLQLCTIAIHYGHITVQLCTMAIQLCNCALLPYNCATMAIHYGHALWPYICATVHCGHTTVILHHHCPYSPPDTSSLPSVILHHHCPYSPPDTSSLPSRIDEFMTRLDADFMSWLEPWSMEDISCVLLLRLCICKATEGVWVRCEP